MFYLFTILSMILPHICLETNPPEKLESHNKHNKSFALYRMISYFCYNYDFNYKICLINKTTPISDRVHRTDERKNECLPLSKD